MLKLINRLLRRQPPFYIVAYCLERNGVHADYYLREECKREAMSKLKNIINREYSHGWLLTSASVGIEIAGTDC